MGMNWGAFAGAAAQSGLSTYERLEEQKLKQLQRSQLEKEIAEKEALDTAWRNSQARVGQQDEYGQAIKTEGFTGTQQAQMLSDQGALPSDTPDARDFEQEVAKSATGALRENAVRQGAIPADKAALPELKPTEYTSGQAMKDYVKAAGQVSRKGTLEALQMKSAIRESDLMDEFDTGRKELNDTLALIQGTEGAYGMEGISKKANEHGIKNKFIAGKNGVGSRIDVLGPKGDVIQTISDISEATKALKQAAFQKFYNKSISLLGSSDKVIAAMQGERQVNVKEREVGVKEAIAPSEISKNYGIAGYYSAGGSAMGKPPKKEVTNADFNNFLEKFGDKPSSVIDKKSGKPLPVSALSADQQWTEARKHYNASGAAFAENGDGLPDVGKGGLQRPEPVKEKPTAKPTARAINTESSVFEKETRLIEQGKLKGYSPEAMAEVQAIEASRKQKNATYLQQQQAQELERSKLARPY